MKKLLTYHRRFSELPGIQTAKTVCYALTCRQLRGRSYYGIRVSEAGVPAATNAEVCLFTDRQTRAERLLTYLYENAITAAHCISVISDVCEATNWTEWMDESGTNPNSAAHCG